MYAVYILLCSDKNYYTGLTNDLEKRIWQHETGFFPDCYTSKRRPVKLLWHTIVETSVEANKLEKQIKGWLRKKKEALINNDIDELKRLSNFKKESINKPLRPFDSSINSKLRAQGLVDFLIIGQGISGTWLSYYLQKEGNNFLVIDNNFKNSPSNIAAGIINPVTGRRHVEVWMANEIIPFAKDQYKQMGNELGITAISQKNIIDFFPTPQMRVSFLQRIQEKGNYISEPHNQNRFDNYFNYDFGCGEINPVYTAHLETILPAWRKYLKENNFLLEEDFYISRLKIENNQVHYKNIIASKIIFCDGSNSCNNPYFQLLPFAPNKGEALIVKIPGLPSNSIYKKGMMLVPLVEPGYWWVGSSYAWEFDNADKTNEFREKTEALLKSWLKLPFKIVDHLVGIRPATLERRPFVGLHPHHPAIGILNGMGTKGCSLAPYFAKQLSNHLLFGLPITPEADINRFNKILSRSVV